MGSQLWVIPVGPKLHWFRFWTIQGYPGKALLPCIKAYLMSGSLGTLTSKGRFYIDNFFPFFFLFFFDRLQEKEYINLCCWCLQSRRREYLNRILLFLLFYCQCDASGSFQTVKTVFFFYIFDSFRCKQMPRRDQNIWIEFCCFCYFIASVTHPDTFQTVKTVFFFYILWFVQM